MASSKTNLVECRGIYMGDRDVYGPPIFLVPIREFKPLATNSNKVPVTWARSKGELKIGQAYSVLFDLKTFEAVAATESA